MICQGGRLTDFLGHLCLLCRGTRSFWMTLLILFMTGMVFVGVYMFIKVTSWAGYRAALRQATLQQEL